MIMKQGVSNTEPSYNYTYTWLVLALMSIIGLEEKEETRRRRRGGRGAKY